MKKQLMVVDDSRMAELQIRKLLEDSDYEVAAYCENGEEAIARYDEIRPDVVTMDIIMEEHPDAKIIMISSLVCDDTIHDASTIGAMTFLYKPVSRDSLLRALENAVR